MSRIAYVNGCYTAHGDARIHVEDRGYQFSDGVYEVCEVRNGSMIDAPRHLDRLERSLAALKIAMPMARPALLICLREIIRRNRLGDGMVYVQVTRGESRRDHAFPKSSAPSIVITARALDPAAGDARASKGVSVVSVPETRWKHVGIKTIGLLPNVLARQAARDAGAFEAWFVDSQGQVVEGAATNAWIVTGEGRVITRPGDGSILEGVTRATLFDVMRGENIPFEERPFTIGEAQAAAEAFCTGATLIVMPVVEIDKKRVGNGRPGPIARLLREKFHDYASGSQS